MPILPAEPQMYPSGLWKGEIGDVDPDRPWWCLHTRPRQEKVVARYCVTRSLTFYLPQSIQESRTPSGRKTRSLLPLFSGYVFLQGSHEERVEALKSNCLNNVLEIYDQTQLVLDLRQIHALLDTGLAILPEPTFPVGARVRIRSGPLTGLVGIVVRREGKERFAAMVNFLSRGATVELHDWEVEDADHDEQSGHFGSEVVS